MDRRPSFSALDIISKVIREHVKEGDLCIDATGIGMMLAEEMQERHGKYRVESVTFTGPVKAALAMPVRAAFESRNESHSEMKKYAQPGSVSCITFNFGWLPKGDHNIFTKKETSIPAIEAGLELLKEDGVMTLILYYGRETGFEEKDALLEYLPTIDSSKYTVVEMPFVNRSNCPPIPILILKGR